MANHDALKHLYALYDNDDMPVIVGTASEMADYLGIKVSSLHSRLSHKKHRKDGSRRKDYYLYDVGMLKGDETDDI